MNGDEAAPNASRPFDAPAFDRIVGAVPLALGTAVLDEVEREVRRLHAG
ncbi:hypothetical protein [Methylobacterium sp. J-076]|nr:hypothetical protein [Methylobacterium sp. J-076]MCJ2014194.1 hypothetical protein [Methylobacterium sp. J-076]